MKAFGVQEMMVLEDSGRRVILYSVNGSYIIPIARIFNALFFGVLGSS